MYEFLLYGFLVIPVFLAVKILGEFFPESPRLLKKIIREKGRYIYQSLLVCREAYIISSKVIALLIITSK